MTPRFRSQEMWVRIRFPTRSPKSIFALRGIPHVVQRTCGWLHNAAGRAEAAGPWDVRLVNDNDGEYFCRVILASNGTRFVPGARAFYRVVPPGRVSYIGRSDKKKHARFLCIQFSNRSETTLVMGPPNPKPPNVPPFSRNIGTGVV
jgi:hypothetical protein